MEDNIKSKNIKFNIDIKDDELIVDYFNTHKDNFSKVVKSLLLDYVTGSKNKGSTRSIIDVLENQTSVLENQTRLLVQIVEKGMVIDNSVAANNLKSSETNEEKTKDKKNDEESGFNIDFLNQIQND